MRRRGRITESVGSMHTNKTYLHGKQKKEGEVRLDVCCVKGESLGIRVSFEQQTASSAL